MTGSTSALPTFHVTAPHSGTGVSRANWINHAEMSTSVTVAGVISAIARVNSPVRQPISTTRCPAAILAHSINIGTQKATLSVENRASRCSVGSCAELKATGSRSGRAYLPGRSAASATQSTVGRYKTFRFNTRGRA